MAKRGDSMNEEQRSIKDLKPDPKQARLHGPRNVGMIADSLQEVGTGRSIVIDEGGVILAGNATTEAAAQVGITKLRIIDTDGDEIIALRRSNLTPEQKVRLALFDNRTAEVAEGWDADVLRGFHEEGVDLSNLFSNDELTAILDRKANQEASDAETSRTLAERFGVPPFSVLDARQGYWQKRKQAWIALGIESEVGREENLLKYSESATIEVGGTSIFDPVLCELAYRWYSPEKARVLDPFAGGSVRGLVAARLGREYVGIDLRKDQIAANAEQAKSVLRKGDPIPHWIEGDAKQAGKLIGGAYDFLFTCPPYYDLEKYSKDPKRPLELSHLRLIPERARSHSPREPVEAAQPPIRSDRRRRDPR
jgi:hypothetical protein